MSRTSGYTERYSRVSRYLERLAAGASCLVEVRFAPISVGATSAKPKLCDAWDGVRERRAILSQGLSRAGVGRQEPVGKKAKWSGG